MPAAPHFDTVQFGDRKSWPVSANVTADGWQSTGIDYADYVRMGTQQRKQSGARGLPTPKWAIDNALLQELLAAFFEERAANQSTRTDVPLPFPARSVHERLDSSRAKIQKRRRPQQTATLRSLCKRFVQEKDPKLKHELQLQIETLDTLLCYTAQDAGVGKVAAIVVLYYRVKMDSVGVGGELGLKPPHVRQVLHKLRQTAAHLGGRFLETA